ncbi:MAG TPA: dephospho-CoA kinase [Phycisphaerales bacterium]|nr:dephospho-CoA kinase [Phycisphaerales bacterium]
MRPTAAASSPQQAAAPLVSTHPSIAYFFVRPPSLVLALGVFFVGLALVTLGVLSVAAAMAWTLLAVGVVLLIQVPRWAFERYEVFEDRAIGRWGIFRRVVREIPLGMVQHAVLQQSVRERFFDAGTILLPSAGTAEYALVMRQMPMAPKVMELLRGLTERGRAPGPAAQPGGASASPRRGLVLGLVGGIGAGKSSVARILEDMGFLVMDADRSAKEALDRPDVRGALVSWWGERVLGPDGRIDRRAVGDIVFADPAERRRLEELVHPIVKAGRGGLVERAFEEGRSGVVIDAPLLFEAGSDADCDAVIFVDAPLEQRRARVRSRGWSDEELSRREAAQLPLDEKKRRSDAVVVNDTDLETLRRRVAGVVSDLIARPRPRRG